MAERDTVNIDVVGSSPTSGAYSIIKVDAHKGRITLVGELNESSLVIL